ncbi:MAG: asparagine synthetase B [Aureispira sp.]|nr:asparagine synthetase B [Aureispira sp.]
MKNLLLYCCLTVLCLSSIQAQKILIPMDEEQDNHLKAYGVMYAVLEKNKEAYWLLNYRGGSFAFEYTDDLKLECIRKGVSYEVNSNSKFDKTLALVNDPEVNMQAMLLEVAPKIAVYTSSASEGGKEMEPWDDAVTLALTYAEIPYDEIYDDEVLAGELSNYDWLHLHHEDFTGQFGKVYAYHGLRPWYKAHVNTLKELAAKHDFKKVSELKLAVAKKIKNYVANGGFMFAMCSTADTYDIALAAEGLDICDPVFDGDRADSTAQEKLNFKNTFAFQNFELITDPYKYEHSTIDNSPYTNPPRKVKEELDYFGLFEFSAKWDPIPTMLTQCHANTIKGFMGQTTAFRKKYIKSNVKILGETRALGEAKYIHGTFGKGFWSFYGGHDPEDYRHYIGDLETDLHLHPNSAGYRLILNNILFPAAKRKDQAS